MSQVALVLLGCGIAVAAEGSLSGFGASAIIGVGAVSTPTSSQLLAVSPSRLAPVVFSIKQTAVPAGLLISGFLVPRWPTRWGGARGARHGGGLRGVRGDDAAVARTRQNAGSLTRRYLPEFGLPLPAIWRD
jgi:hypothetical protein